MDHFNDKGHLTDEALSLYAEALKLGSQEQLPEALREHLEQCPHCQEQAMALYALIAGQDYSELGPHPTFGQDEGVATASTLKMWFRPMLLLLMAVMALFFFRQQQKQSAVEQNTPASVPSADTDSLGAAVPLSPPQAQTEVGSRKPESSSERGIAKTGENPKPKTEEALLAANFTPSETLEPLVGAVTRGSGVSEIKPANGAELKIGEAVVFSWQTSVAEPLTLRLLNNREEEIFSRSVVGNRFSSPEIPEPGLYYWKLETAEDLLYVGKFLIK